MTDDDVAVADEDGRRREMHDEAGALPLKI
jgi:hypothetical protein